MTIFKPLLQKISDITIVLYVAASKERFQNIKQLSENYIIITHFLIVREIYIKTG